MHSPCTKQEEDNTRESAIDSGGATTSQEAANCIRMMAWRNKRLID
jgi:hypothetical protein